MAQHSGSGYRYSLDHTPKKIKCTVCGQQKAKRYFDTHTGKYLPDFVQRCERVNRCGHVYSPKDYFRDHPEAREQHEQQPENIYQPPPPPAVEYVNSSLVTKSMQGYQHSNFARFLIAKYGETAHQALKLYRVGRSAADGGRGTVYWQIDEQYRIRYGKIICYSYDTGKRNKDIPVKAIPPEYKPKHFLQTFFGTHLLHQFPDKPVAIVESEKSAVIFSCIISEYNWLATGGSSGCKWRDYEVYKCLKDKQVIFFPDFGFYNRNPKYPRSAWMTCYQEWQRRVKRIQETMPGNMNVSRILEDTLPERLREDGPDIADYVHSMKFISLMLAELQHQPAHI